MKQKPIDIAYGLSGEYFCEHCNRKFYVSSERPKMVQVLISKEKI